MHQPSGTRPGLPPASNHFHESNRGAPFLPLLRYTRSRPSWYWPTSRSGKPSPSMSPTKGAACPDRPTSSALPLARILMGAASSGGRGGAAAKAMKQTGNMDSSQRIGSPLPMIPSSVVPRPSRPCGASLTAETAVAQHDSPRRNFVDEGGRVGLADDQPL